MEEAKGGENMCTTETCLKKARAASQMLNEIDFASTNISRVIVKL